MSSWLGHFVSLSITVWPHANCQPQLGLGCKYTLSWYNANTYFNTTNTNQLILPISERTMLVSDSSLATKQNWLQDPIGEM